ncbi:MAG: hypothetical protein DWQ08_12360 [Proteobacteria bacterium]|nr:MAG: hypothetical protein DWQ08_12360 [Pseudomonadota bacterium]
MRSLLQFNRRAGLVVMLFLAAGGAVHAQGWSTTSWYVKCADPVECAPANEVYGSLLEHASGWLGSLGFSEPLLAPDAAHAGLHVAEVNDARITVSDPDSPSESIEYVGIYFARARQLALRSDEYFTLGEPGQSQDDLAYQQQLIYQFTPVHELFHAVQNTHLRMDQYASQGEKRAVDWIIEGTATSVQVEYARTFNPESGAQRESRSFATPLHRPAADETRGTWLFWSQVGEQIGSANNIAWFRDVIEPGRLTESNALDRVDDALESNGGLYRQLPQFFSRLPVDKFEAESHQVRPNVVPKTYRFPVSIREVAGKGARVEVQVPGGDDVTVQFALESAQPGQSPGADLHLIVDGKVQPQGNATYQLPGGGAKTFDVVVANVAPRASDSKPRDAILRVTLLSGNCSLWASVTGDTGGTFQGDVAYYNALGAGEGVVKGMAAGTGVDSGMHDQLQGLMGMMGGFAKMAEQIGLEVDPEVKAKLEAVDGGESQAVEETKAFEQELLHSGSDNFGLTLQALPGGGNSNGLGGLAALMGVAGFNLGASGVYILPQGPGLVGSIDFTPSMVYATVGMTDGNFEGVKFVWEPGKPGYAVVTLEKPTAAPMIHGAVEAELHAEHVYDSGRPKIHVNATFVAREGIQSCMN